MSRGLPSVPSAHAVPVGGRRAWVRRRVSWHRRPIAAAFAFCAVLLFGGAMTASDAGVHVVVAGSDLAAGLRLSASDVRVVTVPEPLAPAGVVRDVASVVGETLASPVRVGEAVTDVRLVGASMLRGLPSGTVASPIRLTDTDAADLLQQGDVIDVLSAEDSLIADVSSGGFLDTASGGPAARVVAADVAVLSVVGGAAGDGLVATTDRSDRLVVLAVTRAQAVELAAASAQGGLSFVLTQ